MEAKYEKRNCGCGTPSRVMYERQQRLIRGRARLYHWKQRNFWLH